jgi:predicted Fe-Mo cluster-binding NifX family protein
MHIAIASSDGETINEHFGKADRLFIYDCVGGCLTLLFVRAVTPLSTGDPGHAFDPQRMAATLAALRDCARVYCTRIGERPREELEKAGIEVVVGAGAIAAICG